MHCPRLATVVAAVLIAAASPLHADSYSDSAGPKPPSKLLISAHKFMSEENWTKALPLLENYLAGTPDDVAALADVGLVYDRTGDRQEARRILIVALSLDPRSLEGNLYLGELDLEEGKLDAAKERLGVLDGICIFGCGEYRQLKLAIKAFEESHAK
jgi:Flp pilus assembly protein TadD